MRLWHKIYTSSVLNLLKYIKLVEIIAIQVIGLVEDKWTFNTIVFIKKKLHNCLNTHLDLCIGSIVNNSLFYKILCMTRPLPNGRTRCVIVQMHS
jgi:hypothetical protein